MSNHKTQNKILGFVFMQLKLFDNQKDSENIKIEELFDAYYDCRRNKRNTANAVAFELDYENNLIKLCEEINNGTYQPRKSIAFIVDKPVKREIFAADFRDRVVHHLVINKLNHLFEKEFIYDSYACRKGKGTLFGINRVDHFIRKCSKNYTKDCYILKLDIRGFFMHINKNILFERLKIFINEKYKENDKELLLELCKKIIYNDPTQKCIVKGKKSNWNGLPNDKSLFYSPSNVGIPIGNLSSQVFANFYMNIFDHYIKSDLKIRYYGRYVDDFVVVGDDRIFLKLLIPKINNFLKIKLHLSIHPKKIYFQHYVKGVKYLGVIIKKNRIYIINRTKGNFYHAIIELNKIVRSHKPTKAEKETFLCSTNSYLGIMTHYDTYFVRKKLVIKNISGWWLNYFSPSCGMSKFVFRIKTIKNIHV